MEVEINGGINLAALAIIGFFIFLFSLLYLALHFIKKIKHRERLLSKKIFYSTFIGGLLFLIVGATNIDTGVQDQLDEAVAENEKLNAEITNLKSDTKILKNNNEELVNANAILTKEKEELSTKTAAAEEAIAEKEALNQKINELEEKNKSLENQVSNLNVELASSKTAAESSGSSSTTNTASANTNESFANCTELRKVYPSGVASDHPAYQSKMDRDKDNWACER